MSKISYIVLPKHDGRRGAAEGRMSSRVIENAMRLLVAIILMCSLVVIIILAAHISVNNQPVQPWVLAPTPVAPEPKPEPRHLINRKYILCKSELPFESTISKSVNSSKLERKAIKSAVQVFGKCVVIHLDLNINQKENSDQLPNSDNWNETASCNKMTGLTENQPISAGSIPIGNLSIPVYDLNGEQLSYGTPFPSKWEALLSSGDEALDRCIRLLLAWRFGGVVWNVEAFGYSDAKVRFIKEVMDSMDDRVLVEKSRAQAVYAEFSCNAVIGTLLRDFESLNSQSEGGNLDDILAHALELYPQSLYLIPSGEVWMEQKRKGLLPNMPRSQDLEKALLPWMINLPKEDEIPMPVPYRTTIPTAYD